MAYDKGLAQRLNETLASVPGIVEKKMFGGIGCLVGGNMACGIIGDDLIVRVGPERYEEALQQRHARPFDFTGRPMKGWIMVSPEGYESDSQLQDWVEQGLEFAYSLPPK